MKIGKRIRRGITEGGRDGGGTKGWPEIRGQLEEGPGAVSEWEMKREDQQRKSHAEGKSFGRSIRQTGKLKFLPRVELDYIQRELASWKYLSRRLKLIYAFDLVILL